MAKEFKSLNGYLVKDETARLGIEEIKKDNNSKWNDLATKYTNCDTKIAKTTEVLKGITRKLLPITGAVREVQKQTEELTTTNTCVVFGVSENNTYFTVQTRNPHNRRYSFNMNIESPRSYDLCFFGGYTPQRAGLYSADEGTKTLKGIYIDGVQVDDFTKLCTVGFEFYNLVVCYDNTLTDGTVINVTNIVNPDGCKIIESVPEGKESLLKTNLITGSSLPTLWDMGDNIRYFKTTGAGYICRQTITKSGRTVVREFTEGGVL